MATWCWPNTLCMLALLAMSSEGLAVYPCAQSNVCVLEWVMFMDTGTHQIGTDCSRMKTWLLFTTGIIMNMQTAFAIVSWSNIDNC